VFPTTIWTTIQQAGEREPAALQAVARRYREPVLEFIRRRGFRGGDAEDLCQDVFLRVLRGGVLAKADRGRGRFRSLILSVTVHAIQDRLRKRGEVPAPDLDPPHREREFDERWALHLAERALDRLREEGSPHYDVLHGHLTGRPQNRNELWRARRKLASLVRREVAYTCGTRADYEAELAYLAPYLRPSPKRTRRRPDPGEE
jgi:RNA polymerase sigma-70 factor (ECF subfamily)